MTGLRTRLGTTMGRVGVGVVAVAVALLSTPVAGATPDGDADAAITQAWDAGGGPTGPLGIKDGGVYPAGAGFGQNFAAGKIFFTPETGAHSMQGAILDKYLSLGGPADGDLGFPTIDEGDGKAPGSRNTTFSAADKPVIFFTPDTGARVVRGAINAAWDRLGGSAGVLGVPTEDEVYRGNVTSQAFTGGQVSWDGKAKTFSTTPPELAEQLVGLEIPGDVTTAINTARRAAGGPLGPLGAADGSQYDIGTDGVGQNFAGGKIFYTPATGANVLTGQVLAKYESVGGPEGDLGFPTSSEDDGRLAPMSKIATFAAADEPVIFWTPDFGAVIVRGAMNAAWAKLGGATGELGAPTSDQTDSGVLTMQKFSGGAISYDESTNTFSTEPPNLASQLSGLEVPARDMPLAPAAANDSGDDRVPWYRPSKWWLLGIVPVVALLGVVAASVLINRRRHDRGHVDGLDDYDDDRSEFESGPVPLANHDESTASGWAMPAATRRFFPDDVDRDALDRDALDRDALDRDALDRDALDRDEDDSGGAADHVRADLTEDQDAIDTAPTRIPSATKDVPDGPEDGAGDGLHADDVHGDQDVHDDGAQDPGSQDPGSQDHGDYGDYHDAEPASGPPSGRHAAILLDEPIPAETSLRLAGDDPFDPPAGYTIKADTKSGLYWTPGSSHYDRASAEIWFASEEFALTNGFVKG